MEADFERFVEDNEDDLYLLGRLVAVFVIGPWLIYKGIAHKDITLMWVGAAPDSVGRSESVFPNQEAV